MTLEAAKEMDKPYECITSFQYGIEVGNRQELVRCKDCKHYHKGFNCDLLQKPIMKGDDWFCADGKRKEGR